ncbi:hypothetical protein [uncultured Chryseobacterium sp.]|uniref:hypothetical protein n=1 Tax=uncultured Chryseobacterium sp. TaxID=259322 RepID=UPI0025CE870F|nr:hypothetical protein [uncultured Chryseobacterium sp.]
MKKELDVQVVLYKYIIMENIKSFFDSFKEFVWDIIGYLLPGSYLLIVLSIIIKKDYFVYPTIGTNSDDFYPFIFIVVSYILGYAIYGLGVMKENILGEYSYIKKIEEKVKNRRTFSLSKELLSKYLSAKDVSDDLSSTNLREMRSIVMGFMPEQDQKVYTFTFRADLSNQIGNTSIILGVSALVFSILKPFSLDLFNTGKAFYIIYFCLIFNYILLRQTRNKFYEISLGLPFSIYTAKST